MKFDQKLIDEIINIVKNEKGKPIPSGIIFSKLKGKYHKSTFYDCINFLVDDNSLRKLFSGKIVMGYENGAILKDTAFEGIIFLNSKGDGFVKKENSETSDVYVNRKNINGALNGDKVVACLMDKSTKLSDSNLKDGVVLKVIERNKDFFTGTFIKNKEGYNVVFDDEKNKLKVILDDIDGLVDGHKILVKIGMINDGVAYGTVSKIIGHKNSVGTDILSIVYDAGLEPEFSDQVINESKLIPNIIPQDEYLKRVDLRELDIITIDPATSKDLDDAIYVKKIGSNLYKLYVCIADVSHYVRPNSLIDQEAFKRGTSVYLVNQVIPMLPHNLSNDICSLNPNEDRLSMVCEMDIDNQGNFRYINVYNAVINSKRRFAYEEINDYLLGLNLLENDGNNIKELIAKFIELFNILKIKREKLGYINFEIPEPKIILDENEKIIDIQQKKSGIAQNAIECFMVAANEAVTIKFNNLKVNSDFIYRVHEKPDEKKIKAFEIEADKLNFKFDKDVKNIKPNTISNWLKNNKNNPNQELINMILLRTMAKAKYSTTNDYHFGLALENYTHFTSPIRRYSDLIVHRLYKMYLLNKDEYSNDNRIDLNSNLNKICEQTTKTEIVATNTERDVNSMKFAEYMENKIGATFNGFVSYITSFGIFVQLENTIEGMARVENVLGDYYEFDETKTIYIGRKTRKILTLGTHVTIKVIGSNKVTKKIDFEIIRIN